MAKSEERPVDPGSPSPGRIDFEKRPAEAHVVRAMRTAAALGEGPIDARRALQGALVVGKDPTVPEAFRTLAGLMPLGAPDEPPPDRLPAEGVAQFDVTEPLERSFEAIPDQGKLWGRDYVAAALLSADPSLERAFDGTGKSLAQLRDDWLRFVSSSTAHGSPELWREVWVKAGVRPPPERLGELLEDSDLGGSLREEDRGAYLKAGGLALAQQKELTPLLLFACLLSTVDLEKERDSEGRVLRFVHDARTGTPGEPIEDVESALMADLELAFDPGISTLSGEVEESSVLAASLDVGVARDVLLGALEARSKTGRSRPATRHHLAPLIGRLGLVAPDLERLGIDLAALRQDLLSFLGEHHPKDDLEAWRELLGLEQGAAAEELLQMRTRAAADIWTYDDLLGYQVYVGPIADPILKGNTRPPLTVGIQAPWGQGKTSLMRMIQARLDPASKGRGERVSRRPAAEGSVQATHKKIRQWLDDSSGGAPWWRRVVDWLRGGPRRELSRGSLPWQTEPVDFRVPKKGAEAKPRVPGLLIGPVPGQPSVIRRLPSVWFNPLYYQDRDQVWAGMAHAILHQLAGQIEDPLERERFWFRLQLTRVNEAALRRDLHKAAVTRFLPTLAAWVVAGGAVLGVVAFYVLSSLQSLDASASALWSSAIGLAGSVGASVLDFFARFRDSLSLDERFESYVSEPDYESRLGLLHLVDTDIDRALRLLVGQYPLAVFVDDLDRCDPKIVADVILAINQFLSLPHRNVYFFLGMDMELVAAALEQVKGPEDGRFASSRRGKSFGWQFMEKFVQLPFIIPQLAEEKAVFYSETLLGRRQPGPEAATPAAEEAEKAERKAAAAEASRLEAEIDAVGDVGTAATLGRELVQKVADPRVQERLQGRLSSRVAELMGEPDSEELSQIVAILMEDLDLNPRAIKRHLSVASLLLAILVARGLSDDRQADRTLVVRAAKLLVDWPEFVHWLQNEPRVRTTRGEWMRTVERLEAMARRTASVAGWRRSVKRTWGDRRPEVLDHPELCRLLRKITLDPPGLTAMVDRRLF